MLVAFGFALLVLAAAVVVLFAMFAELAARVPAESSARRSRTVRPLDDARLGHSPVVWPAALPSGGRSVLLVLSTICNSCEDVARQLVFDPGHADWTEASVVVSTGDQASGEEFITHHRLEQFPRHVDEGGEWISGEFGVQSSPTALVFRDQRLVAAYEFNDVAAVRTVIDQASVDQSEMAEQEEDNRQKEEV